MSTNVAGMPYPQEKPMLAGNPKDSAIAANNQATTRQADLIKATSGGKGKGKRHRYKRNKYGGAKDGVVVPQPQMQYTPTGAAGQNPNDIITQNAGVSIQSTENAKNDSYARVGGSRKRKGGNSNWSWGCYSGGKRKTKSRRSKSYKRKTHKKRRTNRRK